MVTQTDIFKRLFIENDYPYKEDILERIRELLQRPVFDDDCQEFHRFYIRHDYDFLSRWAEIQGPLQRRSAIHLYFDTVRTLPHLYEDEESVEEPPTPHQ
jgi:hypothetical protein